MGKYQVEFSRSAAKEYSRLPEQYKTLVGIALDRLSTGKHLDIKQLKGEKDTFRIRVGRYRILYLRIGSTLLIIKIAHRKDVYK